MDELIRRHGAIMDQYDPEKKIGLSVDEWGTWFDVEPGTNPGFLYQQNTMRDALVAGVTLNIFNKHCDRVKLACIAQMVNVLQSVILTEGEKMLKTPTYHVFICSAIIRARRSSRSAHRRWEMGISMRGRCEGAGADRICFNQGRHHHNHRK